MKANRGKHHLFLTGNDSRKTTSGYKTVFSSKCEKLQGIKTGNNLNFIEKIE